MQFLPDNIKVPALKIYSNLPISLFDHRFKSCDSPISELNHYRACWFVPGCKIPQKAEQFFGYLHLVAVRCDDRILLRAILERNYCRHLCLRIVWNAFLSGNSPRCCSKNDQIASLAHCSYQLHFPPLSQTSALYAKKFRTKLSHRKTSSQQIYPIKNYKNKLS